MKRQQHYKAIAFRCGYVEDAKISWVVYEAEKKYPESEQEAVESLVEYFWQKFSEEKEIGQVKENLKLKACCRKTANLDSSALFCVKCGNKLKNVSEFCAADWLDFILDIHKQSTDEYSAVTHEFIENPYGWSPWEFMFDTPSDCVIVIPERAERLFSKVLIKLHSDLMSQEEIDELENYCYFAGNETDNRISEYVFKNDTIPDIEAKTVTITYTNGAQEIIENGYNSYIKYNTGDEIWLKFDFEKNDYTVTKIKTHDGININCE